MKIEQIMLHKPSGTQASLETIERIHAMAYAAMTVPESLLTPRRPLTTAEEYRLREIAEGERALSEYRARKRD